MNSTLRSSTVICSPVPEAARILTLEPQIPALQPGLSQRLALALAIAFAMPAGYAHATEFDVLLREGLIYDGSGEEPFRASVGMTGDTITYIGDGVGHKGRTEINATGLAIAPGFINMLSWATESLLEDGLCQSDIRQGVTLEVFGEGWSMGPLNEMMKHELREKQVDIRYEIPWTKLSDYLEYLVDRGVSCNVASFVGATTVRLHELGHEARSPSSAELARMKALVQRAMEDGALGLGSALIYEPGSYSTTDELIALAKVAAEYGGMYTSHIRSEGHGLLEAIDELIQIAREARTRAHVHHFKAAGHSNWNKLAQAIRKIEEARDNGLDITANMYTYTAASSGLNASMPPWVQSGGLESWIARLQDSQMRERVLRDMTSPSKSWENLFYEAGTPDNILLVEFKSAALKPLTGKTLGEVAILRGKPPPETAIDLVVEDRSRVGAVYFLMSEENVRRKIKLDWVMFGSDESALSPKGTFLLSGRHPRAYGNFARLLGKYVRDEHLVSLQEAIRRLTSFPAETLRLSRRGYLRQGYHGDVVVFDPRKVEDKARFEAPHQYSSGVLHVFVNGIQVLTNGEHSGNTPGRVIRGPGWAQRKRG